MKFQISYDAVEENESIQLSFVTPYKDQISSAYKTLMISKYSIDI